MKHLHLVLFILAIILFMACSTGSDNENLPYNSYVEAFTTGTISRYTPVYLIFNRDIPTDKLNRKGLSKLIKIKPSIDGTFTVENNRTIVFKPDKGFKRDTKYCVKADLSKWFNAKGKDKEFTFHFSTYPLVIRAYLQSLDINNVNDNAYDVAVTLLTPDKETTATLKQLIDYSEKVETVWQQSIDGKKHQLVIKNVKNEQKDRDLKLSIARNKENVPEDEILSVRIPNARDFKVYDVQSVSDPESYIEVTFTKLLDASQNMEGLAYIEGYSSNAISVDRNKLRIYPDTKANAEQAVEATDKANLFITKNIRSNRGIALKETIVRAIDINPLLPRVQFVGQGVIIPQSSQLTIPFRAVYLRGVVVRVIKVLQQNIGQFLQTNDLDGTGDLMRVGRLIARKTIFFDEDGSRDLSKWNTYAVNLKSLINPEPGAIYRVDISFTRELSTYPGSNRIVKSKSQILEEDKIKFKEESNRFDDGGYFYTNGDVDWSNYKYEERRNPCSDSYYYNVAVGKNVLATNLGLMAMAGGDNEMTVMVHNIVTTNPERRVRVEAYNYQNQLLTSGTSDENGQVRLSLSKGKPYYLIASEGKQRSYLRVDGGSALSLSSFDVAGEVVQKGIKGFIYGERGVWRPGDTLHLGFMLNDRIGNIPVNHPVIMELYTPLGQLYVRQVRTQSQLGLYAFSLATENDAPTGAWNAKVSVGGVTFNKRIRIETIKPNRLKIDLALVKGTTLLRGVPLKTRLHVAWLQGATARNLKYDIQGTFISTPTIFSGYKNFVFDDPSKVFNSEMSKLISGVTNELGEGSVQARFDIGSSAPGMLLANFVTRVFEESGDFSVDASRMLYSPYNRFAGIRPPQSNREQLNTGQNYNYQVASVDYLGRPAGGSELEVNVYKVDWYWWWNSDNNQLANFVSDTYNKPVKTMRLHTSANGLASFPLSFGDKEWGTYFIRVKDKNSNHSAGIMSYFDWPDQEGRRNADGSLSANMLTFKTDKDNYKPGEKMVVVFPSVPGSRAIISIENGAKLLSVYEHVCTKSETAIKINITAEMQPNAYVYVTLLQPHGITKNDLPVRMYGVVPFTVASAESHLNPVIRMANELKPGSRYEVNVSEKSGRPMAYTLAVVDEGLLDLTRFQTPDPWKAFNAREALGVSTWDLYNYVVGAYGGRIDQLFSIGGDEALNKGPKAIVNRFKPVVKFEGPFILAKGEKKRHVYMMPNYNGRVKVMVVAGDGKSYGNAEKSVFVRQPVMILGTLPRVIGTGEEMAVPATVFATENNIGNVQVSISCSSNMNVVGPVSQTLNFATSGDKMAMFRIAVSGKSGIGHVKLTVSGKGSRSVYDTDIEIRSVLRPLVKVQSLTLQPGYGWKSTVVMPGVSGTNFLTLEMSDVQPVNLSSRLSYLTDYPYGCVEQLISKGFPQLYLSEFVLRTGNGASAEKVVKDVIARMRSYQTGEGSFAYWPGGTSGNAWGTIYAAHFLLEAEARGYLVSETMKRNLLGNLHRLAGVWKPIRSNYVNSEEETQAYRLFVLALAQSPDMGAMNRMKETVSLLPMSRWMLASAYALVGRKDVASALIRRTTNMTSAYGEYDETYGSGVRDKAIRLLTLCLLDKGNEAAGVANEISKSLSSNDWMSTQSTAFALIAFSRYIHKYRVKGTMSFTYACGGKVEKANTNANLWTKKWSFSSGQAARVEMKNTGKSALFARIITEGTPSAGREFPYSNGVSLSMNYTDLNGRSIDVSSLQQGTSFVISATIRNMSSRTHRHLVLSEIFPAGWEILNTRYLNGGVMEGKTIGVNHQDIRDDRMYSYIDFLPAGRQLTVKVNLCAVYSGRFYFPAVFCEAMYDRTVRSNIEGKWVEVK